MRLMTWQAVHERCDLLCGHARWTVSSSEGTKVCARLMTGKACSLVLTSMSDMMLMYIVTSTPPPTPTVPFTNGLAKSGSRETAATQLQRLAVMSWTLRQALDGSSGSGVQVHHEQAVRPMLVKLS